MAHTGHSPVLLPCPLAGAKRTFDRRRHQQFESRPVGSQTARELFSRAGSPMTERQRPLRCWGCGATASRKKPETGLFLPRASAARRHGQCDRQTVDAMQASNSYRGFESDALRHQVCEPFLRGLSPGEKGPLCGQIRAENNHHAPHNSPTVSVQSSAFLRAFSEP
jgi:hypothetical protein